jgi:tellurite resistance protein TerC
MCCQADFFVSDSGTSGMAVFAAPDVSFFQGEGGTVIEALSGWAWIGFLLFLAAMLAMDLGIFHRRPHVVRFREAAIWSVIWIGLALLFAGLLQVFVGTRTAFEFLTGYVIEKSLSVDNVFVFAMVFASMRVPRECEHKVLFWGVFGALAMRVAMIFAGTALLERFHWLIEVFGVLLLIGAVKMLRGINYKMSADETLVVRLCRRLFPVTKNYHHDRFFIRENGRLAATPLLLVLVFVEWSDLVFAVDSIPAVLAVSRDPFVVFTSNAFAILGLRSLYFALAGMLDRFHYLHYGLSAILGFVGLKMLLMDVWPIPISVSLGVVAGIALGAVAASLALGPGKAAETV